MKKFEATWKDGYEFYERVFNSNTNKSEKNKIDSNYEWFEEHSRGTFSNILDENTKLIQKLGTNPKDGRDKYGFLDPLYKNIRDNYWNKELYNTDARIHFIDIETRVGTSFKNSFNENLVLKIRKILDISEIKVTLKELREKLLNGGAEDYEYFDEITKTWKNLKDSIYFERNTGFPVPDKALEPISLFQIYDSIEKTMFVLGLRDWEGQEKYSFEYPVKYVKCRDEIHMIETFLALFKKLDPLIIFAWNGMGFDYPYIYNRMKRLGMDTNKLSNYNKVQYKETEFQGQKEFSFSSDGHYFLDSMTVYKKFTFASRPSYSLDTIAEIELGQNKVDHSQYSTFDDFYVNGHDDFVYYGIIDTYLIKKIDDKLNFSAILFMIAEKMGVTLDDAMGTVKPWGQFIANKSMLNNKVMPMRREFDSPNVVGGFVRDPNKGKHKWVISADVNSMYPLLGMVGFNMSPETFVPKSKLPSDLRDVVLQYFNDQDETKLLDKDDNFKNAVAELLQKYNYSLGINGAIFDKTNLGMIPEMVKDIYASRKKAKKTQFQYEQRKILIKEILKNKN